MPASLIDYCQMLPFSYRIKKAMYFGEVHGIAFPILYGDPCGIRTRECMRERHVS